MKGAEKIGSVHNAQMDTLSGARKNPNFVLQITDHVYGIPEQQNCKHLFSSRQFQLKRKIHLKPE